MDRQMDRQRHSQYPHPLLKHRDNKRAALMLCLSERFNVMVKYLTDMLNLLLLTPSTLLKLCPQLL